MRISSFIAAALALAPLAGQAPQGVAASKPAALYVQVGRAWLSPTTAVSDAWLVVEDGVLKAIQPKAGFAPPAGADVVELPEGWALPTFVHAALRGVVVGEDPEEGFTPTAVAADAYDPYAPQKAFADHGVARAFIGTGYARLVPGQGSVVRLNPADPSAPAPLRAAALRINFRDEVRTTPDLWEPPDVPTAERPLPPSTVQGPKTLAGAVARTRALFAAAAAWRAAPRPFAEGEVDLRPFADALAGKLRVRIVADRRGEIRAALELAKELGLKLVIEGGAEAWRLAPELAAAKASVVLRVSRTAPAAAASELPAFADFDGEGHPDAPAILKAAGVPVALVPPRGAPEHDVWFYATRALRNDGSFAADDVLASVTWGAAEILGLDGARDNPTGKPAEFAVFAGSPFETTARPFLVVAEGRVAARAKKRDVTAIMAGRVHTCEGDALRDAVILVEDGKIRSLGRRIAIPAGARRVRAEVVVPGFVDAGTQIGVRQYAIGGDELLSAGPLQAGGLDVPLSKWFDGRMPGVRGAAAAGVTTAALAPTGGRLVSGVVSTVKTSGRGDATLKPASAVVFDLAGAPTGTALKRQLEQTLESGKKYFDAWVAYEKALKEWEAKGRPAAPAAERKTISAPSAAKPRDAVSGTWEGVLTAKALPRPIPFRLVLKAEGKTVTGTATSSSFPNAERSFSGTYDDGVLVVEYAEQSFSASFKAIVGREVMTGTGSSKMLGDGSFEARRTERPADPEEAKPASRPASESRPAEKGDAAKNDDAKKDEPKKDDDGRPKAPRRDVGLEALRELFADRGAAYVFVPSERHAEAVLEVFRGKYDLRTVICSTSDLGLLLERYKSAGAVFSTTAPTATDAAGVAYSPAEAAWRARVGVILRSGPGGDPRTLYALAEAAVRDGVDPDDALRMITRQPARFLGVLDRVGSLDRGKDADLVFLSGEPFEAGTRVVRTMIDGVFVGEGEGQ